jgi:twinkle protein
VSSLSDWEEEYDDYLLHGMKKGYVIGKHNFDEIFSTYTGQIISVTGVPGHGKSDWVDEMVLGYVRNYGWKVAVASPENKPNPIHAGKIEAKIAGKWVNRKDYVRSSWHKKAKEFIDNHYKFIDIEKYSLENVLDITKQLVKRFGVKCLVIDPFNKIKLIESRNKSITDYTADYLFMLDEFARQSDILIILIAHPRKPSTDEKNYRPSFYDIKGGGEFFDMSSHGLAVYRYYELDDVIEVKVLKAKFRHLGKNESSAFFKWDKRSGRFSQYTGTAIDDLGTLIENDENYISEKQEELW